MDGDRRGPASPRGSELAGVVSRNIRALVEVRQRIEQRRRTEERVADAITRFTGSMLFVYLHALLFGAWILVNTGVVPGIRPFDPFPFVMLAMWASVEAIFLSTFVLISQNRMQRLDEQRAELDLQINLLSEHEITRLITLVDAIAAHLGVSSGREAMLDELKKDVTPEAVLEEIEETREQLQREPSPRGARERDDRDRDAREKEVRGRPAHDTP